MDFFDQEARARKQTRRLIWLFGLAVLVILILNYVILASLIQPFLKYPSPIPGLYEFINDFLVAALVRLGDIVIRPIHYLHWLWNPCLALGIGLGTLISITLGSRYKLRQLSHGGPALAEWLGGRCVTTGTTDFDEQRLRHVVEEMALASGTPVPEIYVLDNERGINAFAAGRTRNDAAIGVTRGCVKLLTRDELQGIIAHEFSHILHGDTRLNMKLMGLAHGLFWPTLLGRMLIHGTTEPPGPGDSLWADEDSAPVLPTAPLGFLFVILGSLNLPFVRLLKSAICRQREWLADAAAVQFTRNPAGIAGALKKIGGLYKQGRLDSPAAETASHLYFANSSYDPLFGFLATHPPLVKRVQAIDPAFDGHFLKVKALPPDQNERDRIYEQTLGRLKSPARQSPETLIAGAGCLTAEHLEAAETIRSSLPPAVSRALRESAGAAGVVYALLLHGDEAVRAKQLEILRASRDPAAPGSIRELAAPIQALDVKYRFALAELAVPALRQFSAAQYVAFNATVQKLVECDSAIELFEYALMKMVARRLRACFEGPDLDYARYGQMQDILPECALLLSALAHVGQDDAAEAPKAFAYGARFLNAPGAQIQFVPRDQWDLSRVDAALTRLAKCPAVVQRNILLACGKVVAEDNLVTEREAELLRAIADTLDCPMPPLVEALRTGELAPQT
jgi:Zn-dependent protease with chaperone function